jgi:hypothetical protein
LKLPKLVGGCPPFPELQQRDLELIFQGIVHCSSIDLSSLNDLLKKEVKKEVEMSSSVKLGFNTHGKGR